MTTKRYFYVTEITDCDQCAGSGTDFDGDAFVPCDKCAGTGSTCETISLERALEIMGVMGAIKRAANTADCLANGIQPD